jgi:hypothetical protein
MSQTSPATQNPNTLPAIDALLDSRMSAAGVADSCEDIYTAVAQALAANGREAAFALYDFFGALQDHLERWEPGA